MEDEYCRFDLLHGWYLTNYFISTGVFYLYFIIFSGIHVNNAHAYVLFSWCVFC